MANDKEVVSVLNDLLENERDGEYGFKTCAEQVEASNLKTLFSDRSRGCAEAARELEALIVQFGGEPASGGTAAGALHRGWVQIKGAVGADSELSISNHVSVAKTLVLRVTARHSNKNFRRTYARSWSAKLQALKRTTIRFGTCGTLREVRVERHRNDEA